MIRVGRRPVPVRDPPPDELPDAAPIDSLEAALGMIPAHQKLAWPRWLATAAAVLAATKVSQPALRP